MVEYYRDEFVIFNDPDDTEYLHDDDDNPLNYLDDSLGEKWTMFVWGAKGKADAFLSLWYNTPRFEAWQIIAMNMTHNKLTRQKGK